MPVVEFYHMSERLAENADWRKCEALDSHESRDYLYTDGSQVPHSTDILDGKMKEAQDVSPNQL